MEFPEQPNTRFIVMSNCIMMPPASASTAYEPMIDYQLNLIYQFVLNGIQVLSLWQLE